MLPNYPSYFWATAIAAVILVGVAKAGFGGGIGVLATPLMALTIPVADAAALLLPLLIVIDLLSLRYYRGDFDRPSIRLLLPSAIVGIMLGTLFFSLLRDNDRALRVGIGVLALAFVFYQMGRSLIFGVLERHRPPMFVGALLGVLSGFSSTLAHAGGPPASMYLLPQALPRQIFVGTTVLFFTAVNLIKLVPYTYLDLLNVGNLTTILLLAPMGYVGVRLGLYLNKRFTDIWFNRFIYLLLFLTGIQLVSGQSIIAWFAS